VQNAGRTIRGVAALAAAAFAVSIAEAQPLTIAYDGRFKSHEERTLFKLGDKSTEYIRIEFREPTSEIPDGLVKFLRSVDSYGGQVRVLDESTNFGLVEFVTLAGWLRDVVRIGTDILKEPKFAQYNAVVRGSFSDTGSSVYEITFVRKDQPAEWAKQCRGSRILDGAFLRGVQSANQALNAPTESEGNPASAAGDVCAK
jgi:hypothetical protein